MRSLNEVHVSVADPFDYGGNKCLLYLLVSTHAVIGQFSGPYFLYGPLKFKVGSVVKLFCDLSPSVLNFHSK